MNLPLIARIVGPKSISEILFSTFSTACLDKKKKKKGFGEKKHLKKYFLPSTMVFYTGLPH